MFSGLRPESQTVLRSTPALPLPSATEAPHQSAGAPPSFRGDTLPQTSPFGALPAETGNYLGRNHPYFGQSGVVVPRFLPRFPGDHPMAYVPQFAGEPNNDVLRPPNNDGAPLPLRPQGSFDYQLRLRR
jgi:hypothetical protein